MAENILIIKPSSIGDVVHSLPVLAKLREAHPEARISWLVGTAAAPLLETNGSIRRLFFFRRGVNGLLRAAAHHYALARELADADFDCVIDLQGLLRSALFGFATHARTRIGLGDSREGSAAFYTHRVMLQSPMHAVDRYLQVGRAMGFDASEPSFELAAPERAMRSVDRILQTPAGELPRPYFALSPGARWRSKIWPAANFADAAALLHKRFGGTFFLVGSPNEAGQAAALVAQRVGQAAVNLAGRTSLSEVVALIARADMLITPDTGLMHVADALGTPLVAVFGPTDPALTGPYFQRSRIVKSEACEKSPCLQRDCPTSKCMARVTGEVVAERVAAVLGGAA